MSDLISICIPTCNRLELLAEAVESCAAQSYPDLEIVIADDSSSDTIQNAIPDLQTKCPHPLRYFHNRPPLGQAANVNFLFDQARGERLVLLHDDDLLLPDAVADLAACWDENPDLTAAYGKQMLISMEGEIQDGAEEFNARYCRTADREGVKLSALEAALVQQFPNDTYMMQSEVARHVRYRDEGEFGTTRWCDYDFGLRVASQPSQFYFLDRYTAKYRLSRDAVSKRGNPTYMFPHIESLAIEPAAEWARQRALKRLAPIVIANAARSGQKGLAWRIFVSQHYSWRQKISKAGLYRLKLLLTPRHRAKEKAS